METFQQHIIDASIQAVFLWISLAPRQPYLELCDMLCNGPTYTGPSSAVRSLLSYPRRGQFLVTPRGQFSMARDYGRAWLRTIPSWGQTTGGPTSNQARQRRPYLFLWMGGEGAQASRCPAMVLVRISQCAHGQDQHHAENHGAWAP